MQVSRLKLTLISFFIGMLITSIGHATTLVMMDHEEKTKLANEIVIGTVEEAIDHDWETTPNGNSILHTIIFIHVEKVLKTSSDIQVGDVIPVYRIGGTVDGLDMPAVGSPKFAPNSRVMLFLFKDRENNYRIVGFPQGKFRLYRQQSQEGGYLCLQDKAVLGAHILDPKTGNEVSISDKERRMSLKTLENIINKSQKEANK
ncbi:MAG: hypothetical protein Q8Q33_09750 [Chlamydiota bacterium]|nr:hypothetical protein [Chlamydiota bacterium]